MVCYLQSTLWYVKTLSCRCLGVGCTYLYFFIIRFPIKHQIIDFSDLAAEKKRAAEIEALGSSSTNTLVEEKAALSKSLSENETKLEELKNSFDAVTLENNEKSTEIQSLSGMQFISCDQF